MSLDLSGVSKHYGSARAVSDVSLTAPAGSVVGLVGPNGAGKTTLLKIAAGVVIPDAGERVMPAADGRAQIGTSFDPIRLPGHLSVGSYLGVIAAMRGVPVHEPSGLVADIPTSKPCRALSAGQRRRVGVYSALIGEPSTVLLDEPTAGLDPLITDTFESSVIRAARSGASVVVSSHDLASIARICDWMILLRGGRVAFNGSITELTRRSQATTDVVVTIENPARFLQTIASSAWIAAATKDPFEFVVTVSDGSAAQLNEYLVKHGVKVAALVSGNGAGFHGSVVELMQERV